MPREAKFVVKDLNFYYDGKQALKGINLRIEENEIFAIFGPAHGGKTTLLRALNRLNDLIYGAHFTGEVLLDGQDIYAPEIDVAQLRRKVGMVFARPIPLPLSVYENLAYGPRLNGVKDRKRLDEIVEGALRAAILWDEVKDRLASSALSLSGGQQQRLCIARVLALGPEVILLDEPASGLDPISTLKIEDSLRRLKESYTIVIVPHNVQQAARVADHAAFFLMGEMVEQGPADQMFTLPRDKRTEDYVTGRFG